MADVATVARDAIGQIDRIAQSAATPDELLAALQDLRTFRAELGQREAIIESELTHRLPRRYEWSGGVATVRSAIKAETTDDHALLSAVLDLACLDAATGEVSDAPDTSRFARLVVKACALRWRTTELDAMGIDWSEHIERVRGRRRILLS